MKIQYSTIANSTGNLLRASQHTKVFNAIRRLLVAGVMVGTNGLLSANAAAAVDACGEPPASGSYEPTVLLWRDCVNDTWNMSVHGGGSAEMLTYVGSVTSPQSADQVVGSYLELNDIVDNSDPAKVNFTLYANNQGKDAFKFAFPPGAPVCVSLTSPANRLLVGPNRTPVSSPVDLRTMDPCGHSYLEDADTTDSVELVTDSDLGERPFPRITTGSIKQIGSAEQFSKYNMIALKPMRFQWLSEVQAINPGTMGLRIHSALAYQGFVEKDPCGQGNGMPFAETGPATAGCQVFAGHWLYAPGTRLISAIAANTTTLMVADASRFTVGRDLVIYDGGAGAFVNAEHAKVIARDTTKKTLTLERRGFKSTAMPHPAGAIVAEHVIGNGDALEPEIWVYNQSTTCPRDSNGRRLNEVMADWLAANYMKDHNGVPSQVKLEGILFDSDFHFLSDSGHGKTPDVDNDLVRDDGISSTGENLWGEGLNAFYEMVRERLPNLVVVGGVGESRGYTTLNGTQLEGWPQFNLEPGPTPDYQVINANMSAYSVHMHRGLVGPRYSEGLNKMPTKLYPSVTEAPPDNSRFRFGYGLMLMGDGYYGQMNWHVVDPWWDEYAVDVVPGSSTFGQAITSNPQDESSIRSHSGWMGFPLGPRYRVYDPVAFAPERSLLPNGTFDSGITGWSGVNLSVRGDTAEANRLDGAGALYISRHLQYTKAKSGAIAKSANISVVAGRQYTLAFSVKSSVIRELQVSIGAASQEFTVPDTWSRQVFTFTASTTGNFPVRFLVGRENTEIWVDSVYVFEGNADVFRRDFDHAVVIVNATPNVRTVDLGGRFKRIQGTQDPINDGATVSEVTVPRYDSIVLVRP